MMVTAVPANLTFTDTGKVINARLIDIELTIVSTAAVINGWLPLYTHLQIKQKSFKDSS